MLLTLLVLLAIWSPLRAALFSFDRVRVEARQLREEVKSTRVARREAERASAEARREAEKQKDKANQEEQNAQISAQKANAFNNAARLAERAKQSAQKGERTARRNTNLAVKRESLARERLSSAQQQTNRALDESRIARVNLGTTRAQLTTTQNQLSVASAQEKAAKTNLSVAQTQLISAQTRLTSAQERLRREQENLRKTARLAQTTGRLAVESGREVVKVERRVVALLREVKTNERQVDNLRTQTANLQTERGDLQAQIEALKLESERLIQAAEQETSLFAFRPIRINVGRTLVARTLPPELSAPRVEAHLRSLLRLGQDVAPDLLNAPEAARSSIRVSLVSLSEKLNEPEIFTELSQFLADNPREVSVRLLAARNVLEGETAIPTRFEAVVVERKIEANQMLAQTQIASGVGDAGVFRALLDLTDQGQRAARAQGVNPPQSPDQPDFYENGTNEQLFEALRAVQALKARAQVRLIAAEDLSSTDPLRVRFEVKRAESS